MHEASISAPPRDPTEVDRGISATAVNRTPLPPAPRGFQTRAAHLQHFASLTRDLGRDPIAILERYGIGRHALFNPEELVDCSALIRVVEDCSEVLQYPLFGVQLAKRQSTHVLGILEPLCRAAPDVGSAVRMLVDYLPIVHSPRCMLDVVEGSNTVELRLDQRPSNESHRQLLYGAVLTLITLMRDLTGDAFMPLRVSVAHDRRGRDVDALEAALGCRVCVGAEHSAIHFSKSMLMHPVRSANRLTFRLIHDFLERLRTEQSRSFLQRVEDAICITLPQGGTLVRCAATLGLSPRALQFALDEHGVSFSDILVTRRMDLAREYLLAPHLSIDDIAVRLGYAEQTSFGRAFKRWTGMTPGAFREAAHPRHH